MCCCSATAAVHMAACMCACTDGCLVPPCDATAVQAAAARAQCAPQDRTRRKGRGCRRAQAAAPCSEEGGRCRRRGRRLRGRRCCWRAATFQWRAPAEGGKEGRQGSQERWVFLVLAPPARCRHPSRSVGCHTHSSCSFIVRAGIRMIVHAPEQRSRGSPGQLPRCPHLAGARRCVPQGVRTAHEAAPT